MGKLVLADRWVQRHFEPGSEPPDSDLREWALSVGAGVLIAGHLYITDDAIHPPKAELTGTDLLG